MKNLLEKEPTAKAKAEDSESEASHTPFGEPDLRLSMDQFRKLQKVWYAIGELSDMVDAPGNNGSGLESLRIVNDQGLGGVINKLQEQVDLRKKVVLRGKGLTMVEPAFYARRSLGAIYLHGS